MPIDPSLTIPRWKFPEQPQFQDAILEFDPRKLPSLAEAAATAIFMRLQSPETSPEELRALANALRHSRHPDQKTEHTGPRQAGTMCMTPFEKNGGSCRPIGLGLCRALRKRRSVLLSCAQILLRFSSRLVKHFPFLTKKGLCWRLYC
jgi:hypothetical protein